MNRTKRPKVPAPPGFYGCAKCLQVKPVSEFHRMRDGPGGHCSYCKVCKRAANKAMAGREDNTIAERLWAKVDRSGGPSACWIFTSTAERKGYGVILYQGRVCYAHRVSWILAGRELRDGLVIDHICRTPKCVNPDHLRLVTPGENVRAGIAKPAINARRTHCPKGHEYTPENTAFKEVWTGKTRHGYPRSSPVRGRTCIACNPSMWRYCIVKRDPPEGHRVRKPEWVGPLIQPKP